MLSNTCYEFPLLRETFIIIFREKPNCFKYSFVTIHYFCFIIINTKLVQIVFYERKCKRKITVKNPFTKKCNTMMDPVKIIFQLNQCWIWIYVKQGIISNLFFNNLYESLHRGFPFFLALLNVKS